MYTNNTRKNYKQNNISIIKLVNYTHFNRSKKANLIHWFALSINKRGTSKHVLVPTNCRMNCPRLGSLAMKTTPSHTLTLTLCPFPHLKLEYLHVHKSTTLLEYSKSNSTCMSPCDHVHNKMTWLCAIKNVFLTLSCPFFL